MQGGEILGIKQALIDPDGRTFLTISEAQIIRGQDLHIHSAHDGSLLRTIVNNGLIIAMALSPDGTKVVEAIANDTCDIRRISDGAVLMTLPIKGAPLAWSPDGSKIAVGNSIVNAADGSTIAILGILTDKFRSVAFSPDSARIVYTNTDNNDMLKNVSVFSTTDGSLLRTFTGHTDVVKGVAFSSDNRTIASASLDGTIRLWDSVTGTPLQTLTTGVANYSVAFPPAGNLLASGSAGSRVDLWNVADSRLLHETILGPSVAPIVSVSYTRDGAQLFAADEQCEFGLYNAADLSCIHALPSEHTTYINGVGVTPDGSHIVSVAQNDPDLRVWNLVTDRLERAIPNIVSDGRYPHVYYGLAMSPDSTAFATTDAQQTLRIWRVKDGALLMEKFLGSVLTRTNAIVWSHDGQRLFLSSRGPTGGTSSIEIRSVADGSLLGTLVGHPNEILALAISPDGTLLASAGWDKTVKIWRLSDSTLLKTFTGHTDWVNSLAFSPDSAKLLSGSNDMTAILWNVSDGTLLHTFPAGEAVTSVAMAPDGQTLAIGGSTHLRLWRVSDDSLLNDYTDEVLSLMPNTLAYSSDNSTIVYGRADATVVVAANPYWTPKITLTLNPPSVISGLSSTGTVSIAHPALSGGVAISLQSNNSVAALSTYSLNIPEGATSATFTIRTTPLAGSVNVTLTANDSVSAAVATLSVLPHLAADFHNDGFNDLVFQNQASNLIVIWFPSVLNVLGGSSVSYLPPPDWKVVGVADFNGNGASDLMLQNQTTGKIVVWYMLGTTVTGGEELSFAPGGGYKVVGVGDFNGDGKPDILFQQQGTGQLVIWFLNGATVTGGLSIPQAPAAGYHVVGVGDFSRDGKPDILFQNPATNQMFVWFMNGSQYVDQLPISSVPQAGWQVHAVTDINGDGKPDLVFQNQTTNQILVWFMDGLNYTGGGPLSLVPWADYKLQGPH